MQNTEGRIKKCKFQRLPLHVGEHVHVGLCAPGCVELNVTQHWIPDTVSHASRVTEASELDCSLSSV